MEIHFLAKDVVQTDSLNSLFASPASLVWRDDEGNEQRVDATWRGPQIQSGVWETAAEWIAALNLAAIPAAVVGGLLTNYLWNLIQRGRNDSKSTTSPAASGATSQRPFLGVSSATIVLVRQERRIEFDPLMIDFKSLEIQVIAFIDEKDPAQIENR
jgi:hypothetical protein